MQLATPFNAQQYQPASAEGGSPQLPIGEHKVVITASEPKETNDGTGGYLQLTLQIIEGQYNGMTGIWRLNLWSQKPDAVVMANRQMSSLCYVTGVYMVAQTEQLHGKPFLAVVKSQSSPEAIAKGYTEVKGVKDLAGNDPGKPGAGPAPAQPNAAYGGPANVPANGQGAPAAGPWGGNGGAPQGQQPQGQQPAPGPAAWNPQGQQAQAPAAQNNAGAQPWAGAPAAPGGAAPWAR